jgi:hypothetical protein
MDPRRIMTTETFHEWRRFMAQHETYEARSRVVDADHRTGERGPGGSAGGRRIMEYLSLLALALVAILLVGLVSTLLFGSSVSTSL